MEVLLNLIGSTALLLWGVRLIRTGILRSFGAELRGVLAASGERRLTAFGGGIVVTLLLQSSMATALLVSTFAARAALSGPIAIATILGADVGSTLVVQLFAQRIHWLGPLFIAIGVFTFLSSTRSRAKGASRAVLGLGLVFLSLSLIAAAAAPLAQSPNVSGVIASITSDRLLTLLLAILLTLLMHSSVATILMVSTLAASGLIALPAAVVMVLGANIGSALLPMISTYSAPDIVRRSLLANLLVRAAGALVAIPVVVWLAPWLGGFAIASTQMLANVHLAFNAVIALCALPFVGAIDGLLTRLLPANRPADLSMIDTYLDDTALGTPAVALASASRQALKIAEMVQSMLLSTIQVFRGNDVELRQRIEAEDDAVDRQYEAVKLYLARLAREELDQVEGDRSIEILSFTTNLEHIGDIIDKNLMELANKKIKARASFSEAGMKELEHFHGRVAANLELALNVFVSGDLELARRLLRQKTEIRDLERRSIERHLERIGAGRSESLDTSSLHLDVLRDLKRINSHLTSVAYPILERAGELAESRLKSEPKATDATTSLEASTSTGSES